MQDDSIGPLPHFLGALLGKRITVFPSYVVSHFFLDLTPVKQWLAAWQRDDLFHQVIEALFAFTLDVMAGQVVDRLSPIREYSFDPAVDRPAHRIFKVQSVDILAQQCGAHQTLKPFIPQTIEPPLRKQLALQRQLFANDQELGIGLVAFG
jgi:hypothetical protein